MDRIEILIVRGNARWTQVTPQVARQVAIALLLAAEEQDAAG